MQKLPVLSYNLVKELDKLYPPVNPDLNISDRELWGKIYQRKLVENLLFLAEDTKDNNESD